MIKIAYDMLDEVLAKANESADPAEFLKNASKEAHYLKFYIELATDDRWLDFDIATVKGVEYPRGTEGAILFNKQTSMTIENLFEMKITKHVRANRLGWLMQILHKDESDALALVLKKDLASKYSKLTHEVLCSFLDSIKK